VRRGNLLADLMKESAAKVVCWMSYARLRYTQCGYCHQEN